MANVPGKGKSIRNWSPGNGGSDSPSQKAKFFSTDAHDGKEVVDATNEQKEFVGGSGTPKGPFGKQGKEF